MNETNRYKARLVLTGHIIDSMILPGDGPGHGPRGNFTIEELRVGQHKTDRLLPYGGGRLTAEQLDRIVKGAARWAQPPSPSGRCAWRRSSRKAFSRRLLLDEQPAHGGVLDGSWIPVENIEMDARLLSTAGPAGALHRVPGRERGD